MTTQQLEYFIILCKYKNFTTAANQLFMSQQGLSMAINRLEEEFGTKFFLRTRHGLVLTPQGEMFLAHANSLLETHRLCREHFSVNAEEDSPIDAAVSQEANAVFIMDAVRQYQEQFPECGIRIHEKDDLECEEAVLNRETRIGIGAGPLDEETFECRRLFSSDVVLCVHRSHPLAKQRRITPRHLNGLQIALPGPRMKLSAVFNDYLRGVKAEPEILCSVNELFSIHRIVKQNTCAGVTVRAVSEFLGGKDTVLLPFDPPVPSWDIFLFRRRDAELTKKEKQFFDDFGDLKEE